MYILLEVGLRRCLRDSLCSKDVHLYSSNYPRVNSRCLRERMSGSKESTIWIVGISHYMWRIASMPWNIYKGLDPIIFFLEVL